MRSISGTCTALIATFAFFAMMGWSTGCQTVRNFQRIDYDLIHSDNLVATNLVSFDYRSRFQHEGNSTASFGYSTLVQNIGASSDYRLELSAADFWVNDSSEKAECAAFQRPDAEPGPGQNLTPLLKAGHQIRIECRVRLVASSQNKLLTKDSEGMLRIPYELVSSDSAGKGPKSKSLAFPYRLKIEDFE